MLVLWLGHAERRRMRSNRLQPTHIHTVVFVNDFIEWQHQEGVAITSAACGPTPETGCRWPCPQCKCGQLGCGRPKHKVRRGGPKLVLGIGEHKSRTARREDPAREQRAGCVAARAAVHGRDGKHPSGRVGTGEHHSIRHGARQDAPSLRRARRGRLSLRTPQGDESRTDGSRDDVAGPVERLEIVGARVATLPLPVLGQRVAMR
eukprot:3909807-Prymnesium_polylepis.1